MREIRPSFFRESSATNIVHRVMGGVGSQRVGMCITFDTEIISAEKPRVEYSNAQVKLVLTFVAGAR